MLKTYSEETIIQVGVLETKWEFSRRSQLNVDKKHWHGWPTQVSRESRSGIESTSSKRCSWSETFPRANQLLQRVHAKPVNSSTSPDTTFGEESSVKMDRTVRGSIPQSERNDHFRASSNTLWSQPAAKACLWCIPYRYWTSAAPRDKARYQATYSLCFKDSHHQDGANLCTDSIIWG